MLHAESRHPARIAPVQAGSILLLGLLVACAGDRPPRMPNPAERAAIDRSTRWLSDHPPDPRRDALGDLVLDLMSWHVLASLHPDGAVRERAGATLDGRLRALPPPGRPGMVPLSYWAPALALASRRGIELDTVRATVSGWDTAALIDEALPHTRLWIEGFLHDADLAGPPDPSSTLLFRGATLGPAERDWSTADAYRLFHALVPLTDFGTRPASELDSATLEFARGLVPTLLEIARTDGDVDGVAEALVCSALLGLAESDPHRVAVDWLLARQRDDGTYRLGGGSGSAGSQRHVVLTASWALLAPRS